MTTSHNARWTCSGSPRDAPMPAAFREGQVDAIRDIFDGCRRRFVVQKTGWGKCFLNFIATKLRATTATVWHC